MSQSSSSFGLPTGSIRAGFETAARTHAAAVQIDGRGLPAVRQIAAVQPGTPVEAAIADAAQRTTVDFDYLLAQAEVESSLNPNARATTSSASGLYQFIDNTWLGTVKKHGDRFGLGAVADEIGMTASGSAYVADPARREAILALRNDPQVASLMAAGLAEDNRAHLMPILGRQPNHSELYLAHFLGAGGAGRFLSELQADPNQSAPALFARPAAANRRIFYSGDGSPRSLAQVMDVIGGKLGRALDRASDRTSGRTPGSPGESQASRFARADYAPAAVITRTPYMMADDDVFGPGRAPALTQASLPSPTLRASSSRRAPMSQVLGATFGTDPGAAPAQVRRAYDRLKAFGL
ncbi:MAG: transglycosylase SLT domain-containing protein [Erythrobacter sp.]|nr:transglycosylase SLT domain-containing protein [Erythrobacter sp.]